eukprot:scaffold92308_cov17-Prasinocladus_malaysianus.AAC.1
MHFIATTSRTATAQTAHGADRRQQLTTRRVSQSEEHQRMPGIGRHVDIEYGEIGQCLVNALRQHTCHA